ncbi:conserved hypothetical protein [Cupriavidus taiwanensis]|uniref:hypothetical protein n=1 Tax=Cupriavidus taiwanensis TaxID=164546 RepID=UPI000E181C14|nr:hypothetical protein [Cupriavidus taiwanensis]SOZ18765.1 conserved hypothetical protein [Cupriavidus taiwanensis]SOZ31998.1 conserved hypothetical protein [Cupriavidus taiwanensis]SOZ47678.1 conserved hypothetical protein [Cupriavidus taiwanensis]SPA16007.1 conserved hypothetical protein [Cupriavidus taiwanensis]
MQQEAVRICQRYSRIPGITPPFTGRSLVWQDTPYFYVSGIGQQGRPRLIEVFLVNAGGELEPVLTVNYPRPLQEEFPEDLDCLFQPALWEVMI